MIIDRGGRRKGWVERRGHPKRAVSRSDAVHRRTWRIVQIFPGFGLLAPALEGRSEAPRWPNSSTSAHQLDRMHIDKQVRARRAWRRAFKTGPSTPNRSTRPKESRRSPSQSHTAPSCSSRCWGEGKIEGPIQALTKPKRSTVATAVVPASPLLPLGRSASALSTSSRSSKRLREAAAGTTGSSSTTTNNNMGGRGEKTARGEEEDAQEPREEGGGGSGEPKAKKARGGASQQQQQGQEQLSLAIQVGLMNEVEFR